LVDSTKNNGSQRVIPHQLQHIHRLSNLKNHLGVQVEESNADTSEKELPTQDNVEESPFPKELPTAFPKGRRRVLCP